MRFRHMLITASLLAANALPSWAASYYVAPQGAVISCKSDGSLKCPWPSLDAAFAAKKIVGGDTVLLMDGAYGGVRIGAAFDKDVTIQSQNGKNAQFSSVQFTDSARRIALKNVSVWRSDAEGAGVLIRSFGGASFLTFDGVDVRGRKDVSDRVNWSAARWTQVAGADAGAAFELRGPNAIVRNSSATAVRMGIVAWGANSLVENNVVDGFTNDGMKGGSYGTFRNNRIMNRFRIDDSHSDGFQAYSPQTMTGLTLEGNVILEWTNAKNHPLRGTLQGIGMFNGYYDDLLIQNNLISTRHYNGITVLGARRARIINNTVVNIDGLKGIAPWIRVSDAGANRSQDVLVANNIAMQFQGGNAATNVVFANNSVILYPANVLQNIATFDYRPNANSGFIDTGLAAYAPAIDILKNPRPVGKGPDRGAYETGTSTGNPLSIGSPSTAGNTAAAPLQAHSTTDTVGKRVKPPVKTPGG